MRWGRNRLSWKSHRIDGYLLQHFKKMNIPVHGVEPAANVAVAAEKIVFPRPWHSLAKRRRGSCCEGRAADLMAANNVLAHVPGTLDFVKGFATLLQAGRRGNFEFPHVLNLINDVQFDTIYHEHIFYLVACCGREDFRSGGCFVFRCRGIADPWRLAARLCVPFRRGPSRVTACGGFAQKERAAKLDSLEGYEGFDPKVREVKRGFLAFLEQAKKEGKRVAAYGAACQGNTFLNYCGINDADMICVSIAASKSRTISYPLTPANSRTGKNSRSEALLSRYPPQKTGERDIDLTFLHTGVGGRFVIAVPQIKVF